jgi:D-arabinose 1-dehydrogenase-like Zn-dependent alcohol dehydrogenase
MRPLSTLSPRPENYCEREAFPLSRALEAYERLRRGDIRGRAVITRDR